MPADQILANILDETITALSNFDLAKLQALESQIIVLADSDPQHTADSVTSVRQKQRSLEALLQNCGANLGALKRLHAKNMRNRWAQ